MYFIWIKYLSWIGYANEILIINQWRDVTDIPCESSDGTSLVNVTACFTNGQQIIERYSMSEVTRFFFINWISFMHDFMFWIYFYKDNFALDFVLLGVLILTWRSLACIILIIKAKLQKWTLAPIILALYSNNWFKNKNWSLTQWVFLIDNKFKFYLRFFFFCFFN